MAKKIIGNPAALMDVITVGYMAYSVFFLPPGVVPNFKLIFTMFIFAAIMSGIYTFKYYPDLFFYFANDVAKTHREAVKKKKARKIRDFHERFIRKRVSV